MKSNLTVDDLVADKESKQPIGRNAKETVARQRAKLEADDVKRIEKQLSTLARRKAHEDRIVEHFEDHLDDCIGRKTFSIRIPTPMPPRPKCKATPEEAVLVISDPHVGKIVLPQQTLGFGDYNLKKFFDELHFLEQTVTRMIQNNIHNPVQRLHVLLLGDLVEGMLSHASEIPMRELVADQVLVASLAFYQFIARISRVVPELIVRGVPGNHGRFPNQKKPPTENRFSNFDFIVMGQIESLFRCAGPSNVKVLLEENPFQVFDIFQWRFKIGHGDHLKGGDKALGIPAHSMARDINTTTQRYAAIGKQAPDYFLVGDKHRHMSASTARGRYMVNGSWFECDGYAMAENFSPNRPFQMFFGVHPTIGKTWQYDLFLDKAPAVEMQYDLPERLMEKVLAND
jgi:hypothetical protein